MALEIFRNRQLHNGHVQFRRKAIPVLFPTLHEGADYEID